MNKQASQFSTFGKILENGRMVNVVIIRHNGTDVVVRPIHEFHRVIALNAKDVFERFA